MQWVSSSPAVHQSSILDKLLGKSGGVQSSMLEAAPLAEPPEAQPSHPPQQQHQPQQAVTDKPRQGTCHYKHLPIGWKKLDFIIRMLRRLPVNDALHQMEVSPKRGAVFVHAALKNARMNAVNQGLDAEKLIVDHIWVTKGAHIKKMWFHGRGYRSIRKSPFTHLNVVIKENPRHKKWGKLISPYWMRPKWNRQRLPHTPQGGERLAARGPQQL
eukprot:jgi/Chrzof1/13780/Cz08g12060.t1